MRKFILVWMCCALALGLFLAAPVCDLGRLAEKYEPVAASDANIIFCIPGNCAQPVTNAASPHLPIRIDSDADFDASHGVSSGNGTVWAPWIIENWEIHGTGYGYCIYMGNTSQHSAVRNCTLLSASGLPSLNSALYLNNVTNGTAAGNQMISSTSYGIYITGNSNYNTIVGNNVSENLVNGMLVELSSFNTLANNTVNDNGVVGIRLNYGANNTVINNTLFSNTDWGIYSTRSDGNIFSGNNICFTISTGRAGVKGVGLEVGNIDPTPPDYSDYNVIANNTIWNNTYGIYLKSQAINNRAFHNNIVNNTNQAYDSKGNSWDDGYPSGGNFWSDYVGIDDKSGPSQDMAGSDGIGDTPYTNIAGTSKKDNYPLMAWYTGVGSGALDTEPPNSTVTTIYYYWHFTEPLPIMSVANDTLSNVTNVTLWYSFSATNTTWSAYEPFASDNSTPFSWQFNFSKGEGYYRFYSIANDSAGNMEPTPAGPDTICGYDATPPNITLDSPANGTVFQSGQIIDLSISDEHLNFVQYRDVEPPNDMINLSAPYDIDTTGWSEGDKVLWVVAGDLAGNAESSLFYFTIDGTPPAITLVTPSDNSVEVPVSTGITIEFTESMNTASVEAALGISTLANNTAIQYAWGTGNKTLYANFSKFLEPNRDYIVTLGTGAADPAGNHLASPLYIKFTTWTDSDGDGIPDESDSDDDGDGVADSSDAFPLDPLETLDSDEDGIGDNADTDDDNDGVLDVFDEDPLNPHVGEPTSSAWIFILIIIIVIDVVLLAIIILMGDRLEGRYGQPAKKEAKISEEKAETENGPANKEAEKETREPGENSG